MNKAMLTILAAVVLIGINTAGWGADMGTAFTYQGRLSEGGGPADGEYDFEFKLYDDPCVAVGEQVGVTVNRENEAVSDGLFTVQLDFVGSDPNAFNGEARWLEIGVRPGDSGGGYTVLSPRQELTPVPYAQQTRGLFVDSTGNVGIGETSPAEKLSVAGTIESTSGGVKFPDSSVQTTSATVPLAELVVLIASLEARIFALENPPGWGTAVLIETDNAGHAGFPQVAVDGSGNAVAVWFQDDGTRYNIWSNRYVAGTGWGTAELIETDNAGEARNSQVAVDGSGNAVAVWFQDDGTRNNIWSNRYVAGTGWGTAELIETNNSGNAMDPQVAIDGSGNAVVVWFQDDGARYNIWSNRYVNEE